MSDFKFDPEDLGVDAESTDTDNNSTNMTGNNLGTGLLLLPFSIIAVYAFVAESTVLSAIGSIIGAGGLAIAITKAFWIVGFILVGVIGIVALLVAINILAAIGKQNAVNAAIAILGGGYLAIGAAGAMFIFTSVPFLVGFILMTNLLVYTALLLAFLVAVLAATVFV